MRVLAFAGKGEAVTDAAGDVGFYRSMLSFDVIGFATRFTGLLVIAFAEQDTMGLPMVTVDSLITGEKIPGLPCANATVPETRCSTEKGCNEWPAAARVRGFCRSLCTIRFGSALIQIARKALLNDTGTMATGTLQFITPSKIIAIC